MPFQLPSLPPPTPRVLEPRNLQYPFAPEKNLHLDVAVEGAF